MKFQVDLAVNGSSQTLVVGLARLQGEGAHGVLPVGVAGGAGLMSAGCLVAGMWHSLCTVESLCHSDYQQRVSWSSLFPYQDREVSY